MVQVTDGLGEPYRRLYPCRLTAFRKHPAKTAGGGGQAASLAGLGFQFQGRS
jgi:hypothetical protein